LNRTSRGEKIVSIASALKQLGLQQKIRSSSKVTSFQMSIPISDFKHLFRIESFRPSKIL